MLLFALAYFGGVLTIVSPCILPVLPFVFARADRPFLGNGLPMLIGMALTFAGVATLAAIGGGWAVDANEYGRYAAMALLALFGITLLLPALADRVMQPLVSLGARLSQSVDQEPAAAAIGSSLVLGVATGLLWAPCAGPILGLILTGAALQGANVGTSLLLAAYAAGAATSLALALLVGGRVFAVMKRSLGVGQRVRQGLGVAVLAGVVISLLGLDTGFLTQISVASTTSLEQGLVDQLHPPPANASSVVMSADGGGAMMAGGGAMMAANPAMMSANPAMMSGAPAMTGGNPAMMAGGNPAMMAANPAMMMKGKPDAAASNLPIEDEFPSLDGATQWLNSPPLTSEGLRGKVVLIDFWTYSCINCLRALPYVKAWADKYRDQGLVVIGVHAPEFAFEKNVDNVKRAVAQLQLDYPVAIDNDYKIWRAFENQFWPAHYFIDAKGNIRHHHFGEGNYDESERVIQELLKEAGKEVAPAAGLVQVKASGAEAASEAASVLSPETYLGYNRAENFISPSGPDKDRAANYAPGAPRLNEWGLSGDWTIRAEDAALDKPGGAIVYKFHARDLHLVLGPADGGEKVRFRVTIDGAPPGNSHGDDTDADGNGVVTGQRLYQLIRQGNPITDHLFQIEFLDAGVEAYSFTFG
jgi:cytochrome c biogenesis protein CcdA/thiol-disulfide isomerase/thioredoxin